MLSVGYGFEDRRERCVHGAHPVSLSPGLGAIRLTVSNGSDTAHGDDIGLRISLS